MANTNEYKICDRLYIAKIDRCSVRARQGKQYTLRCKIRQRGEKEYFYENTGECIWHRGQCRKTLWLAENAKSTVLSAVKQFERELLQLHASNSRYVCVPLETCKMRLYYLRKNAVRYNVWYEEPQKDCFSFLQNADVYQMLAEIPVDLRDPTAKALAFPGESDFKSHPLYIIAKQSGDQTFCQQMELLFGKSDKNAARMLSRTYRVKGLLKHGNVRLLERPRKDYDKEYYLRASDIPTAYMKLSGYRLLHCPYFAMQDSTHAICTINPFRKTLVDAGPIGATLTTWNDFYNTFACQSGKKASK